MDQSGSLGLSCTRKLLCCIAGVAAIVWLAASGCATGRRYFRVTSYPQGATVYVDGESRGQTDFDRLEVDFGSGEGQVILRVEKQGYQPAGGVLSSGSPREVAFFLQEVPRNEEILEAMSRILQGIDRISSQLGQISAERSE